MASSPRISPFVRDWFAHHPKWWSRILYTVSTLIIGLLLAGASVLVTRLEAQLPSPFKLVGSACGAGQPFSALG